MFALLVQAVLPTAAMASNAGTDPFGVICVASGTTTATPATPTHQPTKGPAGMPCQDCLAAAMAVIQTPELAIQPVAYAVARIEHETDRQRVAPRARATPRPPGQGPPTA